MIRIKISDNWFGVVKSYEIKFDNLQKLSKKFDKIHRKIPVWQSLSNTVKRFHAVRLATFLKTDPITGL